MRLVHTNPFNFICSFTVLEKVADADDTCDEISRKSQSIKLFFKLIFDKRNTLQ